MDPSKKNNAIKLYDLEGKKEASIKWQNDAIEIFITIRSEKKQQFIKSTNKRRKKYTIVCFKRP